MKTVKEYEKGLRDCIKDCSDTDGGKEKFIQERVLAFKKHRDHILSVIRKFKKAIRG